MKSKQEGWVVLGSDKEIYEFTFSSTRTDAIHKLTRLWEKPANWKAHYYKGFRCVKAERTITLYLQKR